MRFTICEEVYVTIEVEAESATEALEAYLTEGIGWDKRQEAVEERFVLNERGVICDVEEN